MHASLIPGARLGRYELVAPLAHGGMGDVWIARLEGSHGFERHVAVKTIRREHAADEKMRRMFLDEARVAARLEHPNVVRLLDLGDEEGELYLAMEYVDGDSLRALHAAAGGKVPLPIALRILSDVCAGLHAAHELTDDRGAPLGLVHRDVSLDNALVGIDGRTRLIDFGVAKVTSRLTGATETDAAKGRLGYMAPEQALGQGVDRRADVFSVGAVAFHLFEGSPPVRGPEDLPRVWGLFGAPAPLVFASGVPARVERIVRQALARDRRARFATAAALGEALEEALREIGEPATASDVAAFARLHLAASIERRRALVASRVVPVRRGNRGRIARVALTLAAGAVLGGAAALAVKAGVPSPAPTPAAAASPPEPAPLEPPPAPVTQEAPAPAATAAVRRAHAPVRRVPRAPKPTPIADDETIK